MDAIFWTLAETHGAIAGVGGLDSGIGNAAIALVTLTALEIVLGIDNIVFIAILVERLEPSKQAFARRLGLALGMIMRILLLLVIGWVMRLEASLFEILGNEISGKDLILIFGGLFLIGKATVEIHHKLEGPDEEQQTRKKAAAQFGAVITQIVILDLVFSLDSVITAVGMAKDIEVMVAAVVIAVIVMMVFAGPVASFVKKHPTVKMLALSFLILIGVALLGDGLNLHIPKGYIYFAMAFSLVVEALNLRASAVRRAASRD